MKKIIAMILAVTMILSVGSFAVFAAGGDPVTLTLEVAGEPSTSGAVANPAKADDIFEVTLKATDFTATTVKGLNQVRITWDPAVIVPVTSKGANAAATSGYVHTLPRQSENEDGEIEGYFSYQPLVNIEEGWYDITQYIAPANENSAAAGGNGYAIPAGATEVELWRIRFKVIKEGDTKLAISEEALYAPAIRFDDFDAKSVVTVKPAAISIPYGSTVDPKPEVVTKTIESVDVSAITTKLQAPVSYTIPTTLKGKIAGSDETVDVTVAWTPAVVTESVKATGTVTAPADTETVKYVLADAAKTLTVDFTVEPAKPEVVTKTIESVDVSAITTALKAPVSYEIPTTLKGKIAGSDETVDVTVAWTPAVVTESVKATGTVTAPADTETVKYVLADAAKTLTVDFTVEPADEPDPENPVISAIAKPEIPATVEMGGTVELPKTVKATVDGKEVELPIVWEPAEVDTTKPGVTQVVGTVNTEGYDVPDDVETTFSWEIAIVEPAVEEPEDIEIVSVVAPEITVYVGTSSDDVKAMLGKTVVGLTKDGEEVAVNVAWSGTVDTKKTGNKSVKGTLTAPEGYVLTKKLTTVTATVHVEKVPADTTIDSVESIAPITVFVGDEVALPATVVGYVTETTTVDVTVEWPEVDTTEAGVQEITGKLVAPKGYDLAEGLTEVKAIITVIALADLPVEINDTNVNVDNGQVVVKFSVKDDFTEYEVGGKTLDQYNEMFISITYMDGITPVTVTSTSAPKPTTGWTGVESEFKFTQTVPEDADTIQYCIIVGYDPEKPVSIDNLGIPVGVAKPYVIK